MGSRKMTLQTNETATTIVNTSKGRLMAEGRRVNLFSKTIIMNHNPINADVNTRLKTSRLSVPVGKLKGMKLAENRMTTGENCMLDRITSAPTTSTGKTAAARAYLGLRFAAIKPSPAATKGAIRIKLQRSQVSRCLLINWLWRPRNSSLAFRINAIWKLPIITCNLFDELIQ